MRVQQIALLRWTLRAVCLSGIFCQAAHSWAALAIVPAKVALRGNFAQAQLLVRDAATGDIAGARADLTHRATWRSSAPGVVSVDARGRLRAVANGKAEVSALVGGESRSIAVDVAGVSPDPKVNFTRDIVPILSKAGCNAGACHASQFGKGNFKLSVFGFAPDDDYAAIVRDLQGRRVNMLEPEKSLVLLKPTRTIAHGGNRRLDVGSPDYEMICAWLRSGAAPPADSDPHATRLDVFPESRVGEQGFEQQLQVVAHYDDGQQRDVTAWAKFDSMDESVIAVGTDGLARSVGRGQASVMVRFEGQAQISTLVTPYASSVELGDWKDQNYIDAFAREKFKELGIQPSRLADDATFMRRAYLDSIGTLPSVEDATAFLDSKDEHKREKLVDRLLGLNAEPAQNPYNENYAAYWSVKWADLIRSASTALGERGMWTMHNWIRDSFFNNAPIDRFARQLITAKGSIYRSGPANFYRIARTPVDMAETTSQLFLGVRLQCAKCHHHPYEKYSQEDYYAFAACFANVATKRSDEFGVFGNEEIVVLGKGTVRHPRTDEVMTATPLEGKPLTAATDKRKALAAWMTSRDNRYFAQNIVNRYMAYFLGRGLVEPVDDLRATNPPSNPALMKAMTERFAGEAFNLKRLIRDIMTSRLYQLDSQPTASNKLDSRFYSHYSVKRVPAEPLLDAIDYATGSQTKFASMPMGTRAIDLPDAIYDNIFLRTFGKPRRAIVCECERVSAPNLSQALSTLNGTVVAAKIADPNGRVARTLAGGKSFEDTVGQLYLASLSRRPTEAELESARKYRKLSAVPKAFYEDLLWSLVNSKQFLFVR